ncbi:alpha/beta hydrolase family protein [Geodermatophilus sp. URMC 63]
MARPPRLHFPDEDLDGRLARTLSMALVSAADLGEAMAAASRVDRPDRDRWHAAWAGAAAAAEDAAALVDAPAEQVAIPYAGTTLEGWLFAPDASGTPRPTVLLPCGYDSTAEYGWADVPAALARGYNALTFEDPGQGAALIEQGLVPRPDLEAVLTPVLDWLLTRPEVDPGAVVLAGRSSAGHLAPRAAAFEHRLAAPVCDPAQPGMGVRVHRGAAGLLARPVVRAQMRARAQRCEFFGARMAAHGLDDVGAYAGGHCAGLGQQVRAAAVHPRLHRILAGRVSAGAGTR